MIKNNNHKKHLIVLDFDGTIYFNNFNEFNINIDTNNILPAEEFFSQLSDQVELFSTLEFANDSRFILLTGRPAHQKSYILSLLRRKHFRIDEAYFSNCSFPIPRLSRLADESDFLIKYWSAKVDLINKFRNSNQYASITIIDDDKVICAMLKELKFTVIQSQLTRTHDHLLIHFTPFNQKTSLNLLKEASFQIS